MYFVERLGFLPLALVLVFPLPSQATPLELAAASLPKTGQDVETVVVTGQQTNEVIAAKSDVPLLETPQAISVVTADMIEDRGIARLADALSTVAGVTRSSTYGYFDSYQIRGFDAAYGSVYLDGLISANVAGTNNELAGLEQIEVLKGPASMLFGSAPLGGIVNLVSKRPRNETFLDAGVATGSYNLIETTLDTNAPLTESGDVLARLNFVYRDSDSFVRFSGANRIYIAPALTWTIAPRTRITFLGRYQHDHDNPWSPVSAWGTARPSAYGELPIDFSINNSGDQRSVQDQDSKQVGYAFDHAFSDNLNFDQTLRYTHREVDWNNWLFAAGFVDNDIVDGVQHGHIQGRYVYGPFHENDEDFAVDSRFSAKFATGDIRHAVIAGIDYRQNHFADADTGSNFYAEEDPLDILAPDYTAPLIHDPAQGYSDASKSRQTGIYIQDHILIGDRVTLTLGGRHDWAQSGDQNDQKFSPRVGATYLLMPGASLYASWSKSFTPQTGMLSYDPATDTTHALPSETGRNIETGLKIALLDGSLTGMASLFDLVRQNVATPDPNFPLLYYIVTGEQQSRGFELEGAWRPAPGWTLSLAYAYLDAKVTKDNLFTPGAELANVPRNSINLYGEYVVPDGPFADLGMSLGLLYNSSKNATTYPEEIEGLTPEGSFFRLPGYTLVDAGLSYKFGSWQARFNVNNLFDKRYFPDACCVDRVTPGEPRNWRLSITRSL